MKHLRLVCRCLVMGILGVSSVALKQETMQTTRPSLLNVDGHDELDIGLLSAVMLTPPTNLSYVAKR